MMKKTDFFIAILIPVLLILFAYFHSVPILVFAYLLALANLMKPLVLLPGTFITSLSTDFFVIVPGISSGLVFSALLILSLLVKPLGESAQPGGNFLGWLISLTILNFLSALTSVTGAFVPFIQMTECLLLLYLLSIQRNLDLDLVIKLIFWSSLATIGMLAVYYFLGFMDFSWQGRMTMEGMNENRLGMIFCQTVTVLLFSFFYFHDLKKYIALGGFILGIYLAILTGSRSPFIGIIFALAICLLGFQSSTKQTGKIVLMVMLLTIALVVGYSFLMDSDLQVLARFQKENIIEGRGTSRIERMEFLLSNVFPKYPIFGVGIGGENEYALSPGPCHNIIIDPLIMFGIFGFIVYWSFILPIIGRSIRIMRNNNVVMVFPLCLFAAGFGNGMGEVVFLEKFFWNAIALCILFSNNVIQCSDNSNSN